jgi:hypothetical protein
MAPDVRRARAACASVALVATLGACRSGRVAAGATEAGIAATGTAAATAASEAARGDAADGDAPRAEAAAPAAGSPSSPPDDAAPPVAGGELTGRVRHLLEAIGRDDATLAADILFPRDGWMATRDAPDPGKDWDRHVAAPFRKGLHALGRRHHGLDHAQLASIDLGASVTQTTPRRRGWKKALWTVQGSRITFVVDGRTQTLAIREMTAWRGAWYVTRLR